jgi:hypothetical protein
MIKAIQIIEDYYRLSSAQQGLEFQRTQEGYLGGRILGPDSQHKGWRMQAFHDADEIEDDALLPDGMRLVVIPDSLKSTLLCYKPEEESKAREKSWSREQYLISLLGHGVVQPLLVFGPRAGVYEVAKQMVEQHVKEFGVPEPWIGYRIERFFNGSVRGAVDYNADNEPYKKNSISDWRKPGASEWSWGSWLSKEDDFRELTLSLSRIALERCEREPKEEEDLSARSYFERIQKKLGCYTCYYADSRKLGESGCCTSRSGPQPGGDGKCLIWLLGHNCK